MMTTKAFLTFLMPLIVASTATAAGHSLNVKTWEDRLKATLAAGKTDVSSFFAFTKMENEALVKTNDADRKNINAARKLYELGKLDAALKKYEMIDKGSDYWLEAVEEKAWAFHLKKDFEKSLAQTKTLLADPFVQIVGSEPFFLQSLSQLKICDYPGIFATHQIYKDSQRARMASLETLAQSGKTAALSNVVANVQSFPVTFTQIGSEAKNLPRLFYRDLEFQKRLMQAKLTDRGIALIQAQISNSSDVAKKAKLVKAMSLLKKSNVAAFAKMKERLQTLAQDEDKRNQLMLQKLGLIEVETIQRMHADKEAGKDGYSSGKFAKVSTDDLIFPDDNKPWMDELDKYEVSANACPGNVRRKM